MSSSSQRRPVTGNTGAETQAKLEATKREFERLERESQLTSISEAIARIEERLAEFPGEIRNLRRRGFLHTRGIEDDLNTQKAQWRKQSSELKRSLRQHQNSLRTAAGSASRQMTQARASKSSTVSRAETAVKGLGRRIDAAERELRSYYSNVDSDLQAIDAELRRIDWMLDELEASPEITLRKEEGPLSAVEAEWQRDGDEGPKGVLFLTDQRFLFEQKEEVVTKKRFGLFKAESEIVQKLWLDIELHDITSVEDSEEGGFLGMGKDDILELTCTGKASISRARFHLKGQDSSDWRATIKRVQSGEMEAERHRQAARKEPTLSFPTNCPNCLATLPTPHRGASYVTCEFCGSNISPVE